MKRVILFLLASVLTATSWGQYNISGVQTGTNTITATVSPCYGNASTWQYFNVNNIAYFFYSSTGVPLGPITPTEVNPIDNSTCTATLEFPSINFDEVFGGQAASMSFFCPCNGSGTSGEINLIPNFTPLPIKLSNFSFKGNTLYWKTESEVNASHFEIESSQDGKMFEFESTVNALNSSTGNSYEKQINTMNRYYRLKAVDFDGKFSLSEPLLVKGKATETVPTNHGSSWSYEEDLFLFNTCSGLIKKSKNVSLENLPAGIYYIKWNNFKGTIKVPWPGL
ncbi:hypothetical protein KA405_05510 [Patescibacteria group bacterium]|nr:hypothetical protein [Patescibacteria group bacterium]